ncbi:hydantoinase/oxoprolinase N-terminal domain-containing protein [Oleidesulfovibrio sp.]|uniref:hydantoinase/oxoprolinase N-terminal domain-containing protein n=1 Tax=Oleidesulfovibrio sp. TaxID=2909707 RepID=UPI003A85E44E
MDDALMDTQTARPYAATGYVIGVDAGGTYTDAVIVDVATGSAVAWAKSPTTHHQPSISVAASVGAVLKKAQINPADVHTTAVSTTLATNALLEDKGVDVGLFVIGFNQRMEVPAAAARFVPGGHKQDGSEAEPLGIEYLIDHLKDLHGKVDAYAVCSMHGYVNPAHELVAAKAIQLTSKLPVFCSHEASMQAGMRERATTAVLNARLLPVMEQFLAGVRTALADLGLKGSVYVVRGDATTMTMEEAARKAASTVASGPAATACFGAEYASTTCCDFSGQKQPDVLVVDVGGTTTDMTIVRNGNPVIDTGGMIIGEWQTHVDAVEMFTVAVGGDSLVALDPAGGMSIGPTRVVPVCMVAGMGMELPDPAGWAGTGLGSRCVCAGQALTDEACQGDKLLALLNERRVMPLKELLAELNMPEVTYNARMLRLAREQKIFECGFTPTDALHVLEAMKMGCTESALRMARRLSALRGEDAVTFSRNVVEKVEARIEDAILQHVARREVGGNLAGFLARRNNFSLLDIKVRLAVPVVGIGAASQYLVPGVASRLGTRAVFPRLHEVGNAVGAAMLALKGLQQAD